MIIMLFIAHIRFDFQITYVHNFSACMYSIVTASYNDIMIIDCDNYSHMT